MTTRLAYSLAQAAETTGLSRRFLEGAIKEGKLRSKTTRLDADDKPSGRRLILASELQAYLDGLPDA